MQNQIVSPRAAATMMTGNNAAGRHASSLGAADWLSLAAAPTFALMALLTGVLNGSPAMLCLAADAFPLSGMVLMYLLMSAFHLTAWLKLIAGRRHDARSS